MNTSESAQNKDIETMPSLELCASFQMQKGNFSSLDIRWWSDLNDCNSTNEAEKLRRVEIMIHNGRTKRSDGEINLGFAADSVGIRRAELVRLLGLSSTTTSSRALVKVADVAKVLDYPLAAVAEIDLRDTEAA